jgi:hypothetical protein
LIDRNEPTSQALQRLADLIRSKEVLSVEMRDSNSRGN